MLKMGNQKCQCGCGGKIIPKSWHKNRNIRYIKNHAPTTHLSKHQFGNVTVWNKGLTKENDNRLSYDRPTAYKKGQVSPRKGVKHTEEAKEKTRLVNTGKKYSEQINAKKRGYHPKSEFKKGIVVWNKGTKGIMKNPNSFFKKERTAEIEKRRVENLPRGGTHYKWKGGKSYGDYGIQFNSALKKSIRQRDKYRCQECFRHQDELYSKKGKKYSLIAHHIDYNKKNNNYDNLISLCRPCHLQIHYKEENWTDYFHNKINGGVIDAITGVCRKS